MFLRVLLLLALAVAPAAARADAVFDVLDRATTLAGQRDSLRAVAADPGSDAATAGAAWHALGQSYEYDGAADSALACYRRAIEHRGAYPELAGAVDLLFRRAAEGDAAEAVQHADRAAGVELPAGVGPQHVRARQAWARHLAGRSDEAHTMFSRIERALLRDPLWLLRLGQFANDRGEPLRAFGYLHSVALRSRGQAADALEQITRVADKLGSANEYGRQLEHELAVRDQRHAAWLEALGARRIQFAGGEQAPIGATLFAPEGVRGRPPAVVALISPEDSLLSWDSLAVRLRDAGFAVILMDARGSGFSVSRATPLPASWSGRRAALTARTAADFRHGLRALALATPADTTRYTVAASGSMAYAALLAAEADPRVAAVVLISPDPLPVERGLARGVAARAGVPVYLTQTRIDLMNGRWIEPLHEAAPAGSSRLVDLPINGTGPAALGSEADAVRRLAEWIREKKPPRGPASPPRGSRRGG